MKRDNKTERVCACKCGALAVCAYDFVDVCVRASVCVCVRASLSAEQPPLP